MVIYAPLKRVEEIETNLFNATVCTYANETVKSNRETERTKGQYLQKPKEIERDSFCPYLDGICEKCPC